jgi:hypothetical protein
MRWLLALCLSAICAPAFGQTCVYPSGTCPANFSGVPQGNTTPTLIPNSAYTGQNGVSTSGLDVLHGITYNPSVCGYAAPVGDVQSSCDITAVFPHECIASPSSCYPIICHHPGGSYRWGTDYNGCLGDGTIVTEAAYKVDQLLGVPNPSGGNRAAFIMVNTRLVADPTASPNYGTNNFPAMWQDAKCAMAYMAANPSIFPFNFSVVGLYGASWGSILVGYTVLTPDNAYTWSCSVAAPTTDPKYRAVMGWVPMAPLYNDGALGNACWQNCTAAFQDTIIGNMGWTGATLGTVETNDATLSPYSYDQAQNIFLASAGSLAALKNVQMLWQFGGADTLVPPYWPTTPPYTGGNLYSTAYAFANSTSLRPFFELLPGCIHTCDITTIASPSQIDGFNFLMGTANTGSGGLGGNAGGN